MTSPRSRCSTVTSRPGRIGRGFVRGFGLQRGTFGTSLAHNAHNVVVVGIEHDAMALVVGRLRELGDRTAQLRVDDLLERLQDLVVGRLHANEPSNAKIGG